jgi:cyclopropane fatty-acyl-phospholipid synthase-like methyltransferase
MNSKEVRQILELNERFYQSVFREFSKTRQKPWEGWGRVIDITTKMFGGRISDEKSRKSDGIKILDLGCGNGRFLKFIAPKIEKFEYTGVDMNNDLLSEAQKIKVLPGKQNKKLVKEDVILDIRKIDEKYDVVVAFGLTHHIPGQNIRKQWFEYLPKLLNKPGLLVITFWEFEKNPGDYILGWGQKSPEPSKVRFCHKYSENEIKKIENIFKKSGLKPVEKYRADNKNLYLIFGRI